MITQADSKITKKKYRKLLNQRDCFELPNHTAVN